MWVGVFGVTAAVLQVLGYIAYIRGFARKSVQPNAASSFMWAYGSAFAAYLTWKNEAGWAVLALPLVCATMSLIIAAKCLKKEATLPMDNVESFVFATDLWLTVGYALLLYLVGDTLLVAQAFLILVSLTAVTSYIPVLRSTFRSPQREHPLPWLLWTGAYASMLIASIPLASHNLALFAYPSLCLMLSALVAILATRRANFGRSYFNSQSNVYVGSSEIAGLGMFAGRSYASGEPVWTPEGRIHFHSETNADPYFLGIAPNIWIEPDLPVKRLNHSCSPNLFIGAEHNLIAIRSIRQNEEFTIDYSATEADPDWHMECSCGAVSCRKNLYAIQIAFADDLFPPPASPAMQQAWRVHREKVGDKMAFPQLAMAVGDDDVDESLVKRSTLAGVK